MSIPRLTEIANKTFSNQAVNASRNILYDHDYVFSGNGFTISKLYTINTATTKYFLFDPIGIDVDTYIISLPLAFRTTDGPVTVFLRVGHDYTGGTAITPINRDSTCINPSRVAVTQDPTGTSTGLSTFEYLVGTSATAQDPGGGTTQGELPFIVNRLVPYLLEVVNGSGSNITFELRQTWFEV